MSGRVRMKVRDLRRFLRDNDCVAGRVTGSHEIWKLPNGTTVSLVVNHLNADVSNIVLHNIRKALVPCGITLD